MGTETASVLFTDIVGSTALLTRLGEDRGQVFMRLHDEMMREAILGAGGRVIKGLGDGVMAVFTSAADAVQGAVAVQRAAHAHGRQSPDEAFEIRVGISVGDVAEEDGDLFGSAVVEAARLCDVAQGGQILLADLVRALARGRGEFVFESLGDLELKGLDHPVATCWVGWEPLAHADDAVVPFPPLLTPSTAAGYAGRLALRSSLEKTWEMAAGGAGSQTLLLVGEPGVGKTRTSSELARRAHDEGALVLYGRCDEELALPYEPFVEALDFLTDHQPSAPLGRFPGDLARLVPDLAERVDGLPTAISSDPRAEEHRLLEAVASWLATASHSAGLVLVIDDLHWATRPTLQMLLHVVRHAVSDPDARLLIVGTYRDTDVDRTHPLSTMLADLRRLPGVERLPVEPLTEDEVIGLIQDIAGHDLDESILSLARRAHAETEGNPFFVGEVLRHFIETEVVRFADGRWVVEDPEHIDVPEGVRDVVGRRLNRLSEKVNTVLTAAAVVGRDFHLAVLAEVAKITEDDVLDALDEATRARLVEEVGSDRFRFAHALTRQTLYEELSATRRRRFHGRVVEALEGVRPSDLSGLAHHSLEAGPVGGDLIPAITYSVRAGEQALEANAFADARRYFEQALDMSEDAGDMPADLDLRARCGLGEALRDLGDQAYRPTLSQVIRDALAADDVGMAARAALANGRMFTSLIGKTDHERVADVESVLAREEELDVAQRASLMAMLAADLANDPLALDRRQQLADEACALVEGIGDDALTARVLGATSNPRAMPSRLAELEALQVHAATLADRVGDPTLRGLSRGNLTYLRLMLGDNAGGRRVSQEGRAIAMDEGTPVLQWFARNFSAQYLAWDGDIEGLRAEAQACLELGQSLGEADSVNWWAGLIIPLEWALGNLGAFRPILDQTIVDFPLVVGWKSFRAVASVEAGDLAEVAALVDQYDLRNPDVVGPEMFTMVALSGQVLVLWALRDVQALAAIQPRLAEYPDQWASTGVWSFQPNAGVLAICEFAAGNLERAKELVREAWSLLLEAGVRVQVPMAGAQYAELLDEIGSPDARAFARDIREYALDEARAMGMHIRSQQLEDAIASAV